MCNCELDIYDGEFDAASNSPKSQYEHGQLIVKDGMEYMLKGIGGNGVHLFKRTQGSGVAYVKEEEIEGFIIDPSFVPDGVSIIKSTASSSVELLDVSVSRDEPLAFTIFASCRNELLSLFAENEDLLVSDRVVSLFESETLMDKIPKSWLYDKELQKSSERVLAMTGDEITALFVNYFKEGVCPDWLEADPYFDSLSFNDDAEQSDLEILDSIAWLDFETIEEPSIRITLDRISLLGSMGSKPDIYLQDRGIDYKKVIDAVREKYGLKSIPNKGYDFVLEGCVERYLLASCENKLNMDEIKSMANASCDAKNFKSHYRKFLTENKISLTSTHGYGGGGGECYQAGGNAGFNNGHFDIAPRGLLFAYSGEFKDFNGFVGEKYKYEGKELWEACYNTLSKGLF